MKEHTFDLDARAQMPSLFNPDVANEALDAFVEPDDRIRGGLAFLFCDAEGRLLQPVLVSDVPDPATAEQRVQAMRWAVALCEMVSDEHHGPLSLLLALVRARGHVTDGDRAWHQVALEVCAEADVPLIGTHIVTMEGPLALPATSRAA